ncbi:hypothetical protein MYP_790 [Sporocytophaga myxococcoides]|uniref:Uncharacterized protein n=1 Tax=Sporocytophaga myxococcoides TaxID=153721 RepID=A0A098LBC7_9BACT|nr:hypothetical protein [Sporocytophaga myxococcoides]GAL83563.1 hypothetical protein MYP_790 [Sporocytophaga myxococcoides]
MSSNEGFLRKIEATAAMISILVTFWALWEFYQNKESMNPAGHYYGSFANYSNDLNGKFELFIIIDHLGKVEGRILRKGKYPFRGKIKGSTNSKGITFSSYNPSDGSIIRWNGVISEGNIKGLYQEVTYPDEKIKKIWSADKR